MFFPFFDSYYLLLVVPTIIFSMVAQFKVKSTFAHFSKKMSRRNITGFDAAQALLKANNIHDVKVESIAGSLTDHYDPSSKILRLSQDVYAKTSIAAIGVAAHETGHAIQHAKNYAPLGLRSTLVPLANIGSSFGPTLVIAGLIFSWSTLINTGILLFSAAVLFYFITLPVEFDASRRAVAILRDNATLTDEELQGVEKVLGAAAMTYVASAIVAIANLLRLILLAKDRRD
ncbi:MAG: zinc metallopeptidase [Treponemataceae bacterium]